MELIVFCGVQGAGKTTFYQANFSATHLRISLDMLRTRRRERAILEACLAIGQRAVVDNTNPTRAERAVYVDLARRARFRAVAYRFDTPVPVCRARNEARTGRARVPPAGLHATAARFEPPMLGEGFAAVFAVSAEGLATLAAGEP